MDSLDGFVRRTVQRALWLGRRGVWLSGDQWTGRFSGHGRHSRWPYRKDASVVRARRRHHRAGDGATAARALRWRRLQRWQNLVVARVVATPRDILDRRPYLAR